jgi:hypothetical protein
MTDNLAALLADIQRFHVHAAALASRLERHDPHDGLDAPQRAALRRIGTVCRDAAHAIGATFIDENRI